MTIIVPEPFFWSVLGVVSLATIAFTLSLIGGSRDPE